MPSLSCRFIAAYRCVLGRPFQSLGGSIRPLRTLTDDSGRSARFDKGFHLQILKKEQTFLFTPPRTVYLVLKDKDK